MNAQELREAIISAKAGRAEGFEAILDAFAGRLYGFFFRATASHHDAEDLLGEISLRLVRRLKSYDERGRFEQWLFRIAGNLVRDRIRRIKVRPTVLSLSAEDSVGRPLGECVSDDCDPVDRAVLAAEMSRQLASAMATLETQTQEMILLRHFGQLSYKEIADLLDCPLGTVLARVHRGLKKLRHVMDAKNGPE